MSNGKSKLDAGLVRELAAILREADLGEVEVEHEGLRIRVSKATSMTPPPAPTYLQAPVATPAAAPAPQAVAAPAVSPPAAAPTPTKNAVTSPMVGTVYLSAEPGSKPFVAVGDKVKKGDTLMLIEAMKTFNPVEAPAAGTVKEIIATDAQQKY